MKKFWLSFAHIAVIGAGVAGAIFFPPAAPFIATGMGAVNALIPSPLSPTSVPVVKSEVKSEAPGIQSGTK